MSYKQKITKELPIELTPRLKKIIAACDAKGLEYIQKGEDYHEMEFLDAITKKPAEHHYYVISFYRLAIPNPLLCEDKKSTEVLTCYVQQTGEKFNGEPIQDDRMHGVYLIPETRNNRNLTGRTQKVQVTNEIPQYEWGWTPEKIDEIIAKSEIAVTQFYVGKGTGRGPEITTGNVYAIQNLDDFKRGTWQELWDMGVYNYSTTEPRLDQWRKEGAEVKKQTRQLSTMSTAAAQGRVA